MENKPKSDIINHIGFLRSEIARLENMVSEQSTDFCKIVASMNKLMDENEELRERLEGKSKPKREYVTEKIIKMW